MNKKYEGKLVVVVDTGFMKPFTLGKVVDESINEVTVKFEKDPFGKTDGSRELTCIHEQLIDASLFTDEEIATMFNIDTSKSVGFFKE